METITGDLPKPPVPFTTGRAFTVRSHVTPPPTLVTRDCCRNFHHGREERARLPPVARSLKHPPLLGDLGSDIVEFEILDPIKVGDGHNAQVFNVRILNAQPNSEVFHGRKELVAKVYDPLYLDDDDGFLNPFLCVDKHYTHEVHAYRVLSNLQGNLIPRFYGSYSLDIRCEGTDYESETRTVRLILIERIPGVSMREVDPSKIPQPDRQQMIRSVIDFETEVYRRDIILTDLSPRNVMMVPPGCHPGGNLIFLDFGGAIFNRRLDEPVLAHLELFLGQYISPLIRWNEPRMLEFEDWVDWEWTPWVESEYAHTADTITPEMRAWYCP
ncbi:hypothetical protein BO78DRAFT_395049 [Aspergillus sclerotiicarbonarius CBS 121057]|uniref:Protein kinase domain-containing protein n=1 Tax=Aspergillus sclerotiicarbonarius (strain CBS 121057 / IBT 28362) TaxID=1448318 RepID=A0A319ENF1_ASPSB|nr:hypothetical protein BO78DRAFT_395049 [Aspergillus sclerotiicarbonarius CBS 121057]